MGTLCYECCVVVQMGTKVQMCRGGLSKIITISPRFLAYNKTNVCTNMLLRMCA